MAFSRGLIQKVLLLAVAPSKQVQNMLTVLFFSFEHNLVNLGMAQVGLLLVLLDYSPMESDIILGLRFGLLHINLG